MTAVARVAVVSEARRCGCIPYRCSTWNVGGHEWDGPISATCGGRLRSARGRVTLLAALAIGEGHSETSRGPRGQVDTQMRELGAWGCAAWWRPPRTPWSMYTHVQRIIPLVSLNCPSVGAADGPARPAAVERVPVDMWTGPGDGSDAEQCSPEVPASAGPSCGSRRHETPAPPRRMEEARSVPPIVEVGAACLPRASPGPYQVSRETATKLFPCHTRSDRLGQRIADGVGAADMG